MNKKYYYLVAYMYKTYAGISFGDIEIISKYKLDSYDKLTETRNVIANKKQLNVEDIVILNVILLTEESIEDKKNTTN